MSDDVRWCVVAWQDRNGQFYVATCDGPLHCQIDTNWNPVEGSDPSSVFVPRSRTAMRMSIDTPSVQEFQKRGAFQDLIDTAQRMIRDRRP